MKTSLDHLPEGKRRELAFVVDVLRSGFAAARSPRRSGEEAILLQRGWRIVFPWTASWWMDTVQRCTERGQEVNSGVSSILLVSWALLAAVVLALAIDFAGGLDNIFIIPSGGDAVSYAGWFVGWVFVVTPFLVIAARLVRKLMK